MPTGAELFVESILSLGIDHVFTLVGDHLNEVLRCAAAKNMRIIDMRHEAAVVHSADAWARIHRRPALSLVTGGPGHTNSLTGLATAFLAGSPVIAVSGSRPASLAGRGAFQDIEQVATAAPIAKWADEPRSAAQIPFFVRRAWKEASAAPMGPVHLTIPVDLFTASVLAAAAVAVDERAPVRPDPADIERAVELLRGAERPVIIAGSGVWWADSGAALEQFVNRTRIPVYTITLARGALADGHPLCQGYADPSLNRAAPRGFAEADVILILGKRLDFRLALGSTRVIPAAAKLIQVDINPVQLGLNRQLEIGICADVRSTLVALTECAGETPWPERSWLARVRELRRAWDSELDAIAEDTGEPLHPAAFYRELRRALPRDVLYSWDGGDFAHWGRAMLPASTPGGWLRLGPFGAIGAALPNGLALQLANPGRPVVVITGDGALGFYIAEFDTAVRHNLPIVVIVGNDAGWGLERELQGRADTVACELRATRYDVIMQGFGGAGENVTRVDQVAPAVARAFASGKPYLINVAIRGTASPFTQWKLQGS
jgi:acetolactate synthase-1/2/3 large subunit